MTSRRTRHWVLLLAQLSCVGAIATSTPGDGGHPMSPDAGPPSLDAGSPDSGTRDAGTDAGPMPMRDAGPPYVWDGGPVIINDFIAQMPEGSWREIPNTSMSAVCPSPLDHYACEAITGAWGGGAYDTVNERLILFGGGHSDSVVNTVFTFDLGTAKWRRNSELPGPIADGGGDVPAVYRDIRVESCGLYPSVDTLDIPAAWLSATGYLTYDHCDDPSIASQLDPQQPRSTHTYGSIAFSPVTQAFYVLGEAAIFPSGQTTSPRMMAFDFQSGTWSRKADNLNIRIGAASATDGRGHIIYLINGGAIDYDPTADTWTMWPGSDNTSSYYSGAAVDTARNRLTLTQDGRTLQVFDLAQPGAAMMVTSTGPALPSTSGQLAFEYDAALDRYLAWVGTPTVSFLNPSSNAWVQLVGSGDDPGGLPSNGVYGRMRYSPKYNVFVLVRSVPQNVMLFKPPSVAP